MSSLFRSRLSARCNGALMNRNVRSNQFHISAFSLAGSRSKVSKPLANQTLETNESGKSSQSKDDTPTTSTGSGFGSIGLSPAIVQALEAQNIIAPTSVQTAVVQRILEKENIVIAASTGSGKTLAYTLPVVQNMAEQEKNGYVRVPKRPRCLVLVPTRELATQVLDEVKQIGHFNKVSSTAVLGGESHSTQKKALDKLVDLVVASPGRLMMHKEQGNVHFSQVNTIIIDEVDTMLTQGFGNDIRAILRSVYSRPAGIVGGTASSPPMQLIMATATLTKAVKALLTDVEGGGFNTAYSDPSNAKVVTKTASSTSAAAASAAAAARVKMNIVEVDGLHRSLPNVKHYVEETKGQDKLIVLNSVLQKHSSKNFRTMIFCNTIDSARAVEYALNDGMKAKEIYTLDDSVPGGLEDGVSSSHTVHAISYHGEMNSREREINLNRFRTGESQYLVCTDIAARGIDIPEIDHVILFDYPLNPIDYIHRAGRCGRAGRKGIVTALVTKRDMVLSMAIQNAIKEGRPIDSLSSNKKDYNKFNPNHQSTVTKQSTPHTGTLGVALRENSLFTASSATSNARFIGPNSTRVATGGGRSVPITRPVNMLGRKLSRKKSIRPGVVPMFPRSSRPLRENLRDESAKKIKFGVDFKSGGMNSNNGGRNAAGRPSGSVLSRKADRTGKSQETKPRGGARQTMRKR